MARNIDSTITDVLSGSSMTPFNLIDFTIGDTTYRYTDFQTNLYIDSIPTSGTFQSYSFSFGGTHHSIDSIVDNVDITLLNIDALFTSLFIESDVQGSVVNLWSGLIDDSDESVLGVYRIFTGEIDEWTLAEDDLEFTVVSELYQWTQTTLKKHSSSCRWRTFKGTECSYAGAATWCDRSYARCESLANSDNFGGFRWLPTLEDVEIWWGRKRLQRK